MLFVGYLAVKFEMVIAEGCLVQAIEFGPVSGLCPLKMHQRQLVVLLPDFSPVEDALH